MAWLIVVFLVATAVVATIGPRLARVAGSDAVGLVGLAVLLNGVLLAGLVRQRSGAHRTDTESWSIIAIWLVAVVLILLWHPAVPSCRAVVPCRPGVPSWCAVLVRRPGSSACCDARSGDTSEITPALGSRPCCGPRLLLW